MLVFPPSNCHHPTGLFKLTLESNRATILTMATNDKALSGILSGVSGEYFVAAELSRRGYIASITLRNSKGVDILCSNDDASKSVAIQVKTAKGNGTKWVLGFKAEEYYADNLFYVFVSLNWNKTAPTYHIVPSKIVAVQIKDYYKVWLATPGLKGQKHNENPMRTFKDDAKCYRDRWDLLGL